MIDYSEVKPRKEYILEGMNGSFLPERIAFDYGCNIDIPEKYKDYHYDLENLSFRFPALKNYREIHVDISSYMDCGSVTARHWYLKISVHRLEITNGESWTSFKECPDYRFNVNVPVSERILKEEEDYDKDDYTYRIETVEEVFSVLAMIINNHFEPIRFYIYFDHLSSFFEKHIEEFSKKIPSSIPVISTTIKRFYNNVK